MVQGFKQKKGGSKKVAHQSRKSKPIKKKVDPNAARKDGTTSKVSFD